DARDILEKNKEDIKNLILERKFIPFPPRPKRFQVQTGTAIEEYPAKDGFENNRQLNIIARAILICKELVSYWKEIGYYGICKDVNDLVMQGAVLILYPPTPPENWNEPTIKEVTDRLEELIDIGFDLSYTIIGDIIQLFEQRLPTIGNTLIDAFVTARNDKKEELVFKCLIEVLKSSRKLKGIDCFEFLYGAIDKNREETETTFLEAMDKSNNDTRDNNDGPFKPLEFSALFYNWCLNKFEEDSKITLRCFEDILKTRISVDEYYKQDQNNQVQIDLTQDKFKNECDIFKIYCNVKNFFKPSHLDIISQATHEDILKTLFEHYLPILFKLPMLYKLPYTESLVVNAKTASSTSKIGKTKINRYEKKLSSENDEKHKDEWSNVLRNIHNEIFVSKVLKGTINFREYLQRFWEEYNKNFLAN
ncbi:11193_t:CDS:1, partial [Scutellospora calospora]